jgi:hypothetical protein
MQRLLQPFVLHRKAGRSYPCKSAANDRKDCIRICMISNKVDIKRRRIVDEQLNAFPIVPC